MVVFRKRKSQEKGIKTGVAASAQSVRALQESGRDTSRLNAPGSTIGRSARAMQAPTPDLPSGRAQVDAIRAQRKAQEGGLEFGTRLEEAAKGTDIFQQQQDISAGVAEARGVTPTIPRREPTVATPEAPLVTVGGTQVEDFDAGMSDEDRRVEILLKQSKGEQLTDDEKRFLIRQTLQPDLITTEDVAGEALTGLEERQTEAEKKLEEAKIREAEREKTDIERETERIGKRFEILRGRRREEGEFRKDVAQSILSFSGFGRSTESIDRQDRIQKDVNQQLQLLDMEEDAQIAMAEAIARGATAEALEGLQDRISNLQEQSDTLATNAALEVASLNAQNKLKGEEALGNLLEVLSTPQQAQEVDVNVSKLLGYVSDAAGNPLQTDENGDPIALELDEETKTKYQSQFNPITGDQIIFNPTTGRNVQTIRPDGSVLGNNQSGNRTFTPAANIPAGGMRTDRHNNPTAFTTDIAKMAGLVEGVDYAVGDPFPNNPNFRTAQLLGDPYEITRKVIDNIGFYTQRGGQRWTHTAMPFEQWESLTSDQKDGVIAGMYQKEGGSGELAGSSASLTPGAVTEADVRAMSVRLRKTPKEVEGDVVNWQRSGELPRGKQLGGTEARLLSDGSAAINIMNEIQTIVDRGEFGPIRGLTSVIPVLEKYDISIQKDQAPLKIASQLVGRYMEGGVLRREDEIKYAKMLPQVTDHPEVARFKLQGVLNMLIAKFNTDVDTFEKSGFDVVNFVGQHDEFGDATPADTDFSYINSLNLNN